MSSFLIQPQEQCVSKLIILRARISLSTVTRMFIAVESNLKHGREQPFPC